MKGDELDEICLNDFKVNKSKMKILIIMKIDKQKKKAKTKNVLLVFPMCRLIIRESNLFVSVFYFVIYLSYIETKSVTPLFHKMFISP